MPDIEGLTLVETSTGTGFLVASSQGDNSFAVYKREGRNKFVRNLHIEGPDGELVLDTDGIDITPENLGRRFPNGLMVAQDAGRNFKLVPLEEIIPELCD